MLLAATAFLGILFATVVSPLLRRARREAGEIVSLAVRPAAAAPEHPPVPCRTLRVYFIKPSKYDDRGRVAHFWKGVLPNNTLTVLAALNEAYNRLHDDDGVYVETVIWDEQVDGPVLAETIRGDILDDYLRGELRPSYSVSEGIRAKTGSGEITVPLIAEAQLPAINDPYLRRFASPNMTTVDTSRGCPFTCSYCSVKNV